MLGRGRGRGRGGPSGQIVRDDDGNILEAAGPPPMFPDIAVPGRVENDDRIERLRAEQRRLRDFWQHSAYNLNAKNAADDVKPHAKVERYTDRYAGTAAGGVLQEAMTLDPAYFPQELYSKKDKRISAMASSESAQRAYWAATSRKPCSSDDTDKLMKLLDKHASRLEDGTTSPVLKVKKEDGEEGDEDEDEAEIDDDGDEYEDDDYLQGAHVDDDEGYEDPYADDDNGEAFF